MNWQTQKLGEVNAIKKYLKNIGISFDKNLLVEKSEEPADVVYDNKRYQIVNADFEFQKNINVKKYSNTSRDSEIMFNGFVLAPIEKKKIYGKSANGHTLIIDSILCPPPLFIEKELAKIENNKFDIGFDEVYLVTTLENIKIFPL